MMQGSVVDPRRRSRLAAWRIYDATNRQARNAFKVTIGAARALLHHEWTGQDALLRFFYGRFDALGHRDARSVAGTAAAAT